MQSRLRLQKLAGCMQMSCGSATKTKVTLSAVRRRKEANKARDLVHAPIAETVGRRTLDGVGITKRHTRACGEAVG